MNKQQQQMHYVGVCNLCRAVVPFDCSRTHRHHERYDKDDITKHTIELCSKCHGLMHKGRNKNQKGKPKQKRIKWINAKTIHTIAMPFGHSSSHAIMPVAWLGRKVKVTKIEVQNA